MEFLREITLFYDLEEMLQGLTEVEISRAADKLEKIGEREKAIGKIYNETVRRLWVASARYSLAAAQAMIDARLAIDDIAEQQHKRKADRLDTLKALCGSLFWVQVREELNFHETKDAGLRADWTLVEIPSRMPDAPDFMRQLFGGEGGKGR